MSNIKRCTRCKLIKTKIKIGKYKNNTLKAIDGNGNLWKGNHCPECKSIVNKKYTVSHRRKNPTIIGEGYGKPKIPIKKKCARCDSPFTTLYVLSKFCSKKCAVSNSREVSREKRAKRLKKPRHITVSCAVCKNEFMAINRKITKRHCSVKCYKIENPPKKVINKAPYPKCKTCGNDCSHRGATYCSKKCRPKSDGAKEARRARKRMERERKLKSVPWKEIVEFKKNRPDGYHLDHIIPINHPLVSGLHIPCNFQFLSSEDNMKKSNSFDGTYDNEGWR